MHQHPSYRLEPKPGDHPMKAKMNNWTKRLPCRFLEWTGWYNCSISQRLIGHYRLYQNFKTGLANWTRDMSGVQAYIFQYRGIHGFKHFISRTVGLIYSIATWSDYSLQIEVAGINRQLVNESSLILMQFLTTAETDFPAAMDQAMKQINDPSFLSMSGNSAGAIFPAMLVQFNQENNTYTTNNQYNSLHSEVNIQPVIREGAKGKEKGVFSKKQMLIFFDLIAEAGKLEKIDFSKPNRFDAIADLLHAMTGKGKESFIQELNDCRNRGLYEFNTPGELNQLVIILTNLADIFRAAGFRSVAKLADDKIKELESKKKD